MSTVCLFAWFASSCRSPLLKGKIIINKRQQTTRYLFQTKNRSTLVFYQAQPVPYSTSYLRSLTFTAMSAYPSIPACGSCLIFLKKLGKIVALYSEHSPYYRGRLKFHDLWVIMTNTPYSTFAYLEQLFSLINNRNVDIAYTRKKLKISLQYIKHF